MVYAAAHGSTVASPSNTLMPPGTNSTRQPSGKRTNSPRIVQYVSDIIGFQARPELDALEHITMTFKGNKQTVEASPFASA